MNFSTTPLSSGPYEPKRRHLATIVLRKVLEKVGLPAKEHHDVEHQLHQNIAPVVIRGVFAARNVSVANEMFSRNDRIDFIEEALRKFI
jgi:2-hydroxychromene-2-carboxylate isomerase